MKTIYPVLTSMALSAVLLSARVAPLTEGHLIATHQPADTTWETVLGSNAFGSYTEFEKQWNYLYPWGNEHNGSARMYASPDDHRQVSLDSNVLLIKADYAPEEKGKSRHTPFYKIQYRSGAVHAKQTVTVSDQWPVYEVAGYFKAPVVKGTWPAFWITAVKGWPPESDILEFKGDSLNWQNTFIVPHEANTTKVVIADAATTWHHYKAVLKKVNATDIDIYYYFDGKLTGTHRCNFMNKPMWLIINLQMEGSSGAPGPQGATYYYAKEVTIKRAGPAAL